MASSSKKSYLPPKIDPLSIFSTVLSLHSISCIFPFYHGVAAHTPVHVKHLYPMPTPEQFEKDLEFLLTHFSPISLQDLLNESQPRPRTPKPQFHLSFDDGLSLCMDPIKPILLKKGIPATFFLNSDFVGNRDLFYRYKSSILIDHILKHPLEADCLNRIGAILKLSLNSPDQLCKQLKEVSFRNKHMLDPIAQLLEVDFSHFLENEEPYMNEFQVEELIEEGFTIGGHSVNHPLYYELTEGEQIEQSLQSVDYVCKRFSLPYRVFAFPFTDHGVSQTVFESLFAGGIQASFGTAGLKRDLFPNHYQRIPMEKWPHTARGVLRKTFGLYLPKWLMGKNRVKR